MFSEPPKDLVCWFCIAGLVSMTWKGVNQWLWTGSDRIIVEGTAGALGPLKYLNRLVFFFSVPCHAYLEQFCKHHCFNGIFRGSRAPHVHTSLLFRNLDKLHNHRRQAQQAAIKYKCLFKTNQYSAPYRLWRFHIAWNGVFTSGHQWLITADHESWLLKLGYFAFNGLPITSKGYVQY